MNETIEVEEANEEVNLEEINSSLIIDEVEEINSSLDEDVAVTIIDELRGRSSKTLVPNPIIQSEETDSLENDVADEYSLDWLSEFENQEIKLIPSQKKVKPISLKKKVELTTKRLIKIRKELISSVK